MAPEETPVEVLPADAAVPPPQAYLVPQAVEQRAPGASWWRRLLAYVRSSIPRQIAVAAFVFGSIVTVGHIVGGFIGWWHLYELAFLKGQGKAGDAPLGTAPPLSLVVLPLEPEGPAGDSTWFHDVLSGDLTSELGRLSGSVVISRDTAFTYKGKQLDPREIAKQLNVRYVVRGTVRRTDNDVRLNITLVDGATGRQKWTEQFKLDRSDLARSLEGVSGRLARSLGVELYRSEGQRAAALKPGQVQADDVAMSGWAVWYRGLSRENVLEAMRLFEAAVARDPDSVRGWAGIALMAGTAISSGWAADPAAFRERQRVASRNLERIDRNDVLTYMGRVGPYYWSQDFEGLLQFSRTLVERFPNNPYSHQYYGSAHMMLGRFDECIEPLRKSIQLGPRDTPLPYWRATLAMCHMFAGRNAEAVVEARLAVDANTALAGTKLILAAALARNGQREDALRIVRENAGQDRFNAGTPSLVLLGKEPRLAQARESLIETLKELGLP